MLDQVLSLLRTHDRFLLTTHTRPDGDALGSQIALGRFLEKQGKQVTLLNCDLANRVLDWMPGADTVQVFDGAFEQVRRIAEAEVIIILDTNAADRLEALADPVRNSGAKKLLIDHHTHPEDWFDVSYRRESAAATGELIYEIICAEDPGLIDSDIATALYTAIMTDTGSFRFNSVTPETHRIVADLLARGDISPAPIHTALYDNRSLAAVRLLGPALDRLRLCYDGQVGYTVFTNDMLSRVGADTDDKEGIVAHVLSIRGVQTAVLFSEASGGTKMSFRSQGDTYVNKWAAAFGGGGHRNASGAYVKRPLEETIDAVLGAAPRFLDLKQPEGGALSDEDAAYLSTMLEIQAENGKG